MDAWTWSAAVGILLGSVFFSLTFVFIVAFQYRKFGRFSGRRLLGAGAVSIYAVTLVTFTLLPMPPARDAVCASTYQVLPLHFLSDIETATLGQGLFATLTHRATLQVVFNVLLFIPLGVIVRGFFSRSLVVTVLIGFFVSALIEATQFTGNWGMYACPYRLADIDDVIMNTLGTLAGAFLAPLVLAWMPKERALRAARLEPRPVTVWRRWLGMGIDFFLFQAAGIALVVTYRLAMLSINGALPEITDPVEVALGTLVPALLVFMLPAVRTSGASIGQTAVWMVPRWRRPPSVVRRVLRGASVGGTYALLVFISQLAVSVAPGIGFIANMLLLAAFLAVPLTRGKAGLSGLVTGAVMEDERMGNASRAVSPSEPLQ